MSNEFKNKVIVVTGAASGIGAAICDRYAREGASLILLDIDEAAVKAAADKLKAGGVDAEGYRCDVAHEEDCTAVIEKVIEQRGGIDVLVNNAGITQRSAFVDTEISVYRKVMEVNFFGSLHCTKAAINSLIKRKGVIIVIESLAGVSPLLGRTGYCASKHALHGFFTSLRSPANTLCTDFLPHCDRKSGRPVLTLCLSVPDLSKPTFKPGHLVVTDK